MQDGSARRMMRRSGNNMRSLGKIVDIQSRKYDNNYSPNRFDHVAEGRTALTGNVHWKQSGRPGLYMTAEKAIKLRLMQSSASRYKKAA